MTQRTESYLRQFDLLDMKSAEARNLSHGQRKMLSLACCFACEPIIALLDEPVAGIHPKLAERIVSLLRAWASRERTILLVEHDLDFVRAVADSLAFMQQGRICAQGPPNEMLDRPELFEAYVGH